VLKYIVRRLLLLIPILFGLSLFIIVLVHALPGDPCSSILGEHTSPDRLAACRHGLGLDKPLYQQYFDYMNGLLHGNFGISATNRVSVLDSFVARFPATVELSLAAMLVAIGIGVVLALPATLSQSSGLWPNRFANDIRILDPTFGYLIAYTPTRNEAT
jgi:peptide/nickel transport system permease protein